MGTQVGIRRYAVVMGTALVAHALLPHGYPRTVVFATSVLALALWASWAIRRHRPERADVWWLLVVGLGLSGAGNLVWLALHASGGPADAAYGIYLTAYVCAICAIWRLARHDAPPGDTGTQLDTAIVTTGAAILMWVFVAQPLWAQAAGGGLAHLATAAYPMVSLALVAVMVRLAFGAARRVPAHALLVVGLGALFAADLGDALVLLHAQTTAPRIETLRLLALVVLTAAVLHPSMRSLTEPKGEAGLRLGRARLAVLWAASVAAPVTLIIRLGADGGSELMVVAAGSVMLFTLVVARIWGLLGLLSEHLRREHEDRFRALVDNADDVIVIVGADGEPTYLSPSSERVWGLPTDEIVRRKSAMVHPDDRQRFLEALREAAARPAGGTVRSDGRVWHGDGRWRRCEATMANRLDDPAIRGIVVTCRDVTERWELERQLSHQAFHDPLTGLPNRALLRDRTHQALGAVGGGRLAAVLLLDLDDFKTVNDGLGPAAGDELLRVVGRRLQAAVGPEETVARLGGDEFAVLVPRAASLDEVTFLAARILADVGEPTTLARGRVAPRASLGIAVSRPGRSADDLLRDADAAMYAAKYHDTGSFRVFDPEMHEDAVRRLQLKTDLSTAVEHDELTVVYQPIHELATGEMRGMEALLRWTHPDRGPIPPSDFIPLAEETGAIDALGAFVLRRACEDVAGYRARTGLDVFVTVNVSVVQLQDGRLPQVVDAALRDSGLPAERLTLEVTESVFLGDGEEITAAFVRLRGLGVRLAIDDFGTGYCSLSYLDRIPFDVIKIDKSFVDSLGAPDADDRVTLGILDLVACMGVPAVAEGIESERQLGALRHHGCGYGQGYLFSRPVPMRELSAPAEGRGAVLPLGPAGPRRTASSRALA